MSVPSSSRRGAARSVTIARGAAGARAGPAATVSGAAGAGPVPATATILVPVVAVTSPAVPVIVTTTVIVPVPSAAATTIIVPIVAVATAAATSTIAVTTASVSSVPTTTVASPSSSAFTHTTGDVLDGDDALVELSAISGLLGLLGLIGGGILNEGVVALHVDTNKLAERLKEHLEVFALRGFLVEVDNEESLGGLDVLAAFVFLALGAAIAAGELGAESRGNTGDLPVVSKMGEGGDEGVQRKKDKKQVLHRVLGSMGRCWIIMVVHVACSEGRREGG